MIHISTSQKHPRSGLPVTADLLSPLLQQLSEAELEAEPEELEAAEPWMEGCSVEWCEMDGWLHVG